MESLAICEAVYHYCNIKTCVHKKSALQMQGAFNSLRLKYYLHVAGRYCSVITPAPAHVHTIEPELAVPGVSVT